MRLIKLLLLLFVSTHLSAQYYISGSDPARIKWLQIKTPVARIVFEESFKTEALRLAAFMDSMAPRISGTMSHSPRRVDLLIHNQTAYSNGFVTWAPRRTEFYAMPHQNILSTDWLEHLAIHEYRHVVQIDKLNQGFTKILSYPFGQQAVGGVLGLHLPMWFLEGDAVATETTLTQSGRGRSFEFNRELKAQLVEKDKYTFDKAYLGSYKDYTPDYYKMGYLLTGLARREFGSELWERAVTHTGRKSWQLRPFSRAIKKETGLNQKNLYNKLFDELKHDWRQETHNQTVGNFYPIAVPEDDYLRYLHPTAINDSTLIAELRGPGIRAQIVSIHIPSGKTNTLTYTGIRETEPVTANSNLVAWAELQFHPRWENASWSVIRTHNLKTGKTTTLTSQSYLFAPTIHPSNNIIAAVEGTTGYQFYITLLDALTGETIKQIAPPNQQYILTPSWNQTGENLVCVLQSEHGKAIYTLNPMDDEWIQITDYETNEYRHPVQSGNNIWYTAKGRFSDEIFHIDLTNNEKQQITYSKFGASHPTVTPDAQSLIYVNYSSSGTRPVLHLNTETQPEKNKAVSVVDKLATEISHQDTIAIASEIPQVDYKVKKYSKWNLINLHSWAPVFADFDAGNVHSGFTLMSQNLLGTMVVTAGYNTDPSARQEKYRADVSYRGFFTIIDFSVRKGDSQFSRNGIYIGQADTFRLNTNQRIDHLHIKTGLRVPINISRGAFARTVSPSMKITYQNRSEISYPKELYTVVNQTLVPTGVTVIETIQALNFYGMEYSLYLHNLRRGTSRDVGTRMGQAVNATYRHSTGGNYKNGSIIGLSTRAYFPGIMRYHSLSLGNDYQKKNPGNRFSAGSDEYYRDYRYGDLVSYPRGYTSMYNDDMYVFRSTYSLPLWNPDFSIGALAYLKRVRLSLYYDAAVTNYTLTRTDNNVKENYRITPASYGTEVHADTHFLRFVLPFSVGYRIGVRTLDKTVFHEFILRNSFSGFLVN
ncbi:TolB family protein [Alkaliflexus imshenetskii]|uniref:TolB family protein n=1 Tax=Alkaliflexus imshenetskii TaxID=286730 RepID=UPI0004B304B4|nr:hypothetical protein [Alkaliflexus imshenetskii]